jgi:hypothetical protein
MANFTQIPVYSGLKEPLREPRYDKHESATQTLVDSNVEQLRARVVSHYYRW